MKNVKRILSLVVVLIMVFSLVACSSYKSPLKTMEKIMEGKAKKADVKSLLPKEIWEELADSADMDVDEILEEVLETFEDQGDEDVKATIKVKDNDKLDKDDLKDINEELEDFDLKATAGQTVEVEEIVEVDGDEEENEAEYTMLKIGGKWYCYEMLVGISMMAALLARVRKGISMFAAISFL